MKETYLLLQLFFGHFLGDFTPFLTVKMIAAKEKGKPLYPILMHALVHASFVFTILLFHNIEWHIIILCTLFELFAHFTIDVLKGKTAEKYPCTKNPKKRMFWATLGIDQFLHASCKIFILFWAI